MAVAEVEEGQDATESLADELILLALLLLRFGASLRRSAANRLDELRTEILREIAPADLTGPGRYALADRLGETVLELTRTAYSDIDRDLRAELVALAATVSEYLALKIGDELGAPGAGEEAPPERLEQAADGAAIVGATLAAWLGKLAGDTVFRLRSVLRDGATNQTGPTEAVKATRNAFDLAERNLSPIIRSAITAVFAQVVLEVVTANRRVLAGWVHVSVLDSVTSDLCRSRAGLRFDLDRKPVGHSMQFRVPPLHQNCRSHLAPMFRQLADMPERIRLQILATGRERAFRGRPTTVDRTLDSWLRSRPEAEQRRIVGAKRLEAWRAGRIGVSALLDQAGRPLTLSQVRKALGL